MKKIFTLLATMMLAIGASADTYTWYFEQSKGGWTTLDADGDRYDWFWTNDQGLTMTCHSGSGCMSSASYINNVGVLTPDNWLISPKLELGGTLTFWAVGQDENYCQEHFAVFVSTTGKAASNFTKVSEEFVATGMYKQYTVDLSDYSGEGYVAIRHFNITDMYYLNIDDIAYDGRIIDEIPEQEPKPTIHSDSSELVISNGLDLIIDLNNMQSIVWWAIRALGLVNVTEGDDLYYVTDKGGKILFTYDDFDRVTIAAGTSSLDNISHELTTDDLAKLAAAEEYNYNMLNSMGITKLVMTFDTDNVPVNPQNITIHLQNGMSAMDISGEAYRAFAALQILGVLNTVQEDGVAKFYKDGKLLFTTELSETGTLTLAEGVGAADNFVYTLTEADMTKLSQIKISSTDDRTFADALAGVKTITMKFGQLVPELVTTYTNGTFPYSEMGSVYDDLAEYVLEELGVITIEEDDKDSDIERFYYGNKLLLTRVWGDNSYEITLAPGISEADNIVYELTQVDKTKLVSVWLEDDNGEMMSYAEMVGDAEVLGLVFDTTNGIGSLKFKNTATGQCYTINGMRINGKPAKRGIYIIDGKKAVVK